MKTARDTGLLFQRYNTQLLRNPVWLIVGFSTLILYLALFTPRSSTPGRSSRPARTCSTCSCPGSCRCWLPHRGRPRLHHDLRAEGRRHRAVPGHPGSRRLPESSRSRQMRLTTCFGWHRRPRPGTGSQPDRRPTRCIGRQARCRNELHTPAPPWSWRRTAVSRQGPHHVGQRDPRPCRLERNGRPGPDAALSERLHRPRESARSARAGLALRPPQGRQARSGARQARPGHTEAVRQAALRATAIARTPNGWLRGRPGRTGTLSSARQPGRHSIPVTTGRTGVDCLGKPKSARPVYTMPGTPPPR